MTVDFRDYFWGEKNSGFDVLYRNMKYGYVASKELAEFFRERSVIEETHSKLLSKLAKQANNSCPLGTFAPLWQVLRVTSDKLSTLHAQMVQGFQDLVKEVQRYCEEQHKRHKQVKDEEAATLDIVNLIQHTTLTLQKAKESYNARCIEFEKLKRENASLKDIEKAETKCKKACEEYKLYVERYATVREEFGKKMSVSCQHFQNLEEEHLKTMKDFLYGYAKVLESGHALIGQVHIEFRQQCDNFDIESLLQHFITQKKTGSERPGPISFEEADLSCLNQISSVTEPADVISTDKQVKKEGFLRTKWERQKEKRKRKKESIRDPISSSGEVDQKDSSSEQQSVEVDEEGYTIKPEGPKENDRDSFYSSSDGDSDDDEHEKKIHIEIKPISNGTPMSASVDELRATVGTLTLSPIAHHSLRRPDALQFRLKTRRAHGSATSTPDEVPLKRSGSSSQPLRLDNDVVSIFSPSDSSASTPTGMSLKLQSPISVNSSATTSTETTPTTVDRYAALSELFAEKPRSETPSSEATKGSTNGSRGSTPTGTVLPRPPSRRSAEIPRGRLSPLSMSRTESIGSLTSDFKTTCMPLGSSRGPSPLTIGISDTIPLAVAFQEVVHAYFRGTDESKCQVKLIGEMKLSFPAGIVQVLANNPCPASLSFKLSRTSKIDSIFPNKQLIALDTSQSNSDQFVYEFNMPALTASLRKNCEHSPNASYVNVDILRYIVHAAAGAKSTPLHLVAYWKCEAEMTDLKIEYMYNPTALASLAPISNIVFTVPVDGGVQDIQSKPNCHWDKEKQRAMWRVPELSHHTESSKLGSLLARFSLASGPSHPTQLTAQFVSEGTTFSGADFELVGLGYRLSLVKKQVVTGRYICEWEEATSSYA